MATKKTGSKVPKQAKSHSISHEESKLLDESLKMVASLNSEISKVSAAKDKLEKDVSTLGKKVGSGASQGTSKIKDEIIKEFEPVFKALNIKDIKKELTGEINSLIDLELSKLKSELNSKNVKDSRSMTKLISDLETKLIDAIKSNEKIKEEFSKLKSTKAKDLEAEFNKNLNSTIMNANSKLKVLTNEAQKELNSLKSEIKRQKTENLDLIQQAENLKKELYNYSRGKGLNTSGIEAKVNSLEKETDVLKRLIEKYENELYNRKKDESIDVEQRVHEMLVDAETNLKEVKKDEYAYAQFMVDKMNEIIDNVNEFEDHLGKVEKKSVNGLRKEIKDVLKADRKKFEKELDLKYKADTLKNREDVKRAIVTMSERDLENIENMKKFKDDFANELNNYLDQAKKDLEHLSLETKTLNNEKNIFLEEVDKKVKSEITEVENRFNELFGQSHSKLDQLIEEKNKERNLIEMSKRDITDKAKEVIKSQVQVAKEQISKQVLANREFLNKVIIENKEDKRKFYEDIENKLLAATTQFQNDYDIHLQKFDSELAEKEKMFMEKIGVIEIEKQATLKELDNFKVDIANLTKEYVANLDEELKKIKNEEKAFEKEKDMFISEIDSLTKIRKTELDDFANEMHNQIKGAIKDERDTFDRHEETFRDLFSEKVQNLHDYSKKRMDAIERKFVEKNVKLVIKNVEGEVAKLKGFEANLDKKVDNILKRTDVLEAEEAKFIETVSGHEKSIDDKVLKAMNEIHKFSDQIDHNVAEFESSLSGKVEERMTQFEQQLNKRFLDIDSNFTNFKGVVVDEVEGLIKDVNKVIADKVESVDKHIAKINFAGSEVVKRISDFDNIHKTMEAEIRDIRDDINDVRVKADILSPSNTMGNLNEFVNQMADYEHGLVNLVESLKSRNVPDAEIRTALANKGHPMFYVEMILEHFNEINN